MNEYGCCALVKKAVTVANSAYCEEGTCETAHACF